MIEVSKGLEEVCGRNPVPLKQVLKKIVLISTPIYGDILLSKITKHNMESSSKLLDKIGYCYAALMATAVKYWGYYKLVEGVSKQFN